MSRRKGRECCDLHFTLTKSEIRGESMKKVVSIIVGEYKLTS